MPEDRSVPAWLDRAAGWSWRLLAVAGAVGLAVWVLAKLYLVTLPVAVALILATLSAPPARRLEARGLRPGAAAAVVVVGGVVVLAGIVALLTPSFVDQILALRPTVAQGASDILGWLEQGPLGWDRERIDELVARAQATASSSGSRIFSGVLTGAALVVETLAGLALVLVLLFFFVKDGPGIVDWILARTPAHRRADLRAAGGRAWSALGGYVRGTATVALIDAVGIGVGLAVIGVPLVLPLSILVFLGAFLPVVGAFLAGLVAVLVALADGGVTAALLTLALIVAVQQVEGNVLQPVIMRRAVALHPVVVLAALTAGASVAGIVGAFLSVPVVAVAAAVGNELRLRTEARRTAEPA